MNQQGSRTRLPSALYVFEHKTKNILIHAPHTCTVAFWHISNIPPRISQSQIRYNTPINYIAAILWHIAIQPAVGCPAYKLIYIVWAAHCKGKQDYYVPQLPGNLIIMRKRKAFMTILFLFRWFQHIKNILIWFVFGWGVNTIIILREMSEFIYDDI